MRAREVDSAGGPSNGLKQSDGDISMEIIRLHLELARRRKLVPSGQRKAESFNGAEAQMQEYLSRLASHSSRRGSVPVIPEVQHARISAGWEDGAFDDPSTLGAMLSVIRPLVQHIYDRQCEAMRTHGWSDDPVKNKRIAKPGDIVYVTLFEPMKNKDISVADSRCFSTPVGKYILRRYRAIVNHVDKDHWYGNLLGTRSDRGVAGLPKQEQRMHRKVNDQRATGAHCFDGGIAAFQTRGPIEMTNATYVNLICKSFPFGQVIQPTGSRLCAVDFQVLRKESTRLYNESCSMIFQNFPAIEKLRPNAKILHSPVEQKFHITSAISEDYNDKYQAAPHMKEQYTPPSPNTQRLYAHCAFSKVEEPWEYSDSPPEHKTTQPLDQDAVGWHNPTPENFKMASKTDQELYEPSNDSLREANPLKLTKMPSSKSSTAQHCDLQTQETLEATSSLKASRKRHRPRRYSLSTQEESASGARPNKVPRLIDSCSEEVSPQATSDASDTIVAQPYTNVRCHDCDGKARPERELLSTRPRLTKTQETTRSMRRMSCLLLV